MPNRSASSARAALYHRVSTLDQDPTTARQELRAAATARGMMIEIEVEENRFRCSERQAWTATSH